MSWRSDETPDELEIFAGSIDEKWLIGDRTTRVPSQRLTEKGAWQKVLEEEGEEVLGAQICLPADGNFFFRNAIKGVTDSTVGAGKKWVENTSAGLVIPDDPAT